MIEKFRKLWVLLALVLVFVTARGKQDSKTQDTEQEDVIKTSRKKTIYATFLPVADLMKMIVQDKVDVKTIIKTNEEPHSFELTIDNMKDILEGDLVVYNGVRMESFVGSLKRPMNDDGKFLDLSKGLTLLDFSSKDSDMKAISLHTWLSVKDTEKMLNTIYEKVPTIDSESENFYRRSLEGSTAKFDLLDKKFEQGLSRVKSRDKYFVVFHAAFSYLTDDYGLKQVIVTGISPEDGPTVEQLKAIADFVEDKRIPIIFFEGKATPKVAKVLAKSTNTKTSTLHTVEDLDEGQVAKGYLKFTEESLKSLVEAFNE